MWVAHGQLIEHLARLANSISPLIAVVNLIKFLPVPLLRRPPMPRTIRAPRGTQLTCKNWLIEAAYRMLQNNLDPEVAFDPDNLVVYGGRGRAARNWERFDAILRSLEQLEPDETLLVQSGKPVAVFKTHEDAPRVLIANSNIVPHWATQLPTALSSICSPRTNTCAGGSPWPRNGWRSRAFTVLASYGSGYWWIEFSAPIAAPPATPAT